MEVKPGYKQTEVGAIPEEWKVANLSSVSKEPMQNGLFFKPSLKGRGVKLINVGDLYTRVPINSGALELFDATDEEREGFNVDDGDLFFTRSSVVASGIAHCNIYRSSKPESVVFDSHVIRLRPDTNKVVPSYLFRFCVASLARRYLVSHAKTATMTTIDQGVLGKCPVLLPPLHEQRAIAEALSDADALIESLEQLLVKKRQLKRGAMQELLTGKNRLPGFSGEWEAIALGQMGKCHRGVSYNPNADLSSFDTDSTVRLLRSNNVQEAKIVVVDMQYVDSRRVSDDQQLRASDILICMANGSRDLVGKAGRFTADDGFNYTFGAFMGCFRPNGQTTDPNFVFYLFQTEEYRAHIALLLAGSSINNLTPGSVEALIIRVPSDRAEQAAIAMILSDMDAEITALEINLTKARQIKQGMMQELLTGRIRLVESGKFKVESGA